MEQGIKVIGQYLLVKQTMIAKMSSILLKGAKNDQDKFDFYFEIVQKGDKCTSNLELGEAPIFSEYVKFQGLKVLEKTDAKMVALVIVHENDVIGTDTARLAPPQKEVEPDSGIIKLN